MSRILMALFILCALSCSKKEKLLGDTDWQRKMNSDFKDASKSGEGDNEEALNDNEKIETK